MGDHRNVLRGCRDEHDRLQATQALTDGPSTQTRGWRSTSSRWSTVPVRRRVVRSDDVNRPLRRTQLPSLPSAPARVVVPAHPSPRRDAFAPRLLILNGQHLVRVLDVFADHYTGHRPHRALGLKPPHATRPLVTPAAELRESCVQRRDRLGGVVHECVLAAQSGF